jgi:Fur family transcriptional regulator, ferric uptake regulator
VRMTKQRQMILELLREREDHPSADDVYTLVREQIPKISLGTVYRNLEFLAERGYIQKFDFGGQKRFDPKTAIHYHFCCLECGKVEDIPFMLDAPQLDKNDPWVEKRVIQKVRLEYQGLCPVCAGNNS